MLTIVELPEYQRKSGSLLTAEEASAIISHLAITPDDGALLQGTGGIRKLRWARQGSGKSGGVRVIYYYHNQGMPLFLLTMFGKGEKANLSKAERNELAKLTSLLIKYYGT